MTDTVRLWVGTYPPDRIAACRLPPIAYTFRPKTVRLMTKAYTTMSTPMMSRTIGVPPRLPARIQVNAPMMPPKRTTLMIIGVSGSTWRSCLRRVRRDRSWLITSAAMVTAPSTSVTTSRLAMYPRLFVTEPFEIDMKPPGKPATVLLTRRMARPRKASQPPRVTMNAGTPTYATQNPCQAPARAPRRPGRCLAGVLGGVRRRSRVHRHPRRLARLPRPGHPPGQQDGRRLPGRFHIDLERLRDEQPGVHRQP